MSGRTLTPTFTRMERGHNEDDDEVEEEEAIGETVQVMMDRK